MKLGEKQRLFARLVARLILHAGALGYEVRIAYCLRCKDCPVGKPDSNHKKYLAIDLDLFKDGKYLKKTEDHRPLGEYWKSLHPLCRWGGDFGDGNHYSFIHGGMM